MDDRNIIELFFRRSQDAVAALSQKYGKLCYRIAINILRDSQDAEECENDTYLKVWQSVPPTRPDVLSAYVSRITRNLALTRYRYNHRGVRDSRVQVCLSELAECIPDSQNVEEAADDTVSRAVNQFLSRLDRTTRVLFIQRYFCMESISALSKRFGLKESNISTKLNRTRLNLKKYLEGEGIVI